METSDVPSQRTIGEAVEVGGFVGPDAGPRDSVPSGARQVRSAAHASGAAEPVARQRVPRPHQPLASLGRNWARSLRVPGGVPGGLRDLSHRLGSRRARVVALAGILLLACLLTSAVGYAQYEQQYQQVAALAHDGGTHLQDGLRLLDTLAGDPLSTETIAKARLDFSAALADFTQVNTRIAQVPGIAHAVPHYGGSLAAAGRLAALAVTASQAGIVGCDMLSTLVSGLGNPLGDTSDNPNAAPSPTPSPAPSTTPGTTPGTASGITPAALATVSRDFQQLGALIATVKAQLAHLQPDDAQLDPRLGPLIAKARASLPQIDQTLQDIGALLPVASGLLGVDQPTNYLIEVLDSTELRPGGGFIGNYGIATISGGRLSELHIRDVTLLDRNPNGSYKDVALPPAYSWFSGLSSGWGFRDSNLEADFPTSAGNGEQLFYGEGGQNPVAGVVAITPALIQHLMQLTGPVSVPEYGETVTAANLIDRIHFHQLGADHGSGIVPDPTGHSSQRKRFTELLFEHFMADLRQVAPGHMAALFRITGDALHTKDIQIYLNASAAEAVLQHHHVDDAITAPPGDGLLVVDANIIANKANDFMTYTLQDDITLDPAGAASHHLTLTYQWPYTAESFANDYGNRYHYRDYVRVYVPVGSALQDQSGWQAARSTSAFSRDVWAGFFDLDLGKSGTITLDWKTPAAATHDASGWHYQYSMQRQAGIVRQVQIHVALPSCASQVSLSGGFTADGAHGVTAHSDQTTDLSMGVSYACA